MNKILLFFFLALILVFVGVRIWSDARYQSVPYPNQLAASADGVAVVCGHAVYLFSPDGVKLRTYALPEQVKPTQLFWDKGALCLADMENKNIIVLNAGEQETRNFSGTAINAQFKVVREQKTGNLFLSDGANHRILVFDREYRHLRSFGIEGNNPGEFRFPNNMAFDESGRLLIANTKRSTIDVYSPEGQYLNTLVKSSEDRVYRYPTDFVVVADRLLVLENDGYLENGKVRVYDRTGKKVGELVTGDSRVIGNLAAYDDTIYLTDSGNRRLKTFSLPDLYPLGTFSHAFDAQCADWRREAGLFQALSVGSLVALLLFCAPVIIFYLKIKREEAKEIELFDLGASTEKSKTGVVLLTADPILGIPVNEKQKKTAFLILAAGAVCLPLAMVLRKEVPPPVSIAVMLLGLLSLLAAIGLLMRSGALLGRMRKQTEIIVKKIVRDGKLVLQPGEQVERIGYAQQKQRSIMDGFLPVFTTKRLLLYSLSWGKVARIEQFPFESIRNVQPPSGSSLKGTACLQASLSAGGEKRDVSFHHVSSAYLRLLGEEFSQRIGKTSGVPHAVLCLSCLQPMRGDYCLHCASRLAPDWTSVWLSLLFPGLGQLRNGEMQKGLVYIAVSTILLLIGFISVKAWFYEGADISPRSKANIIYLGIMAPVLYVSNVIDAYRSGIRARKGKRS